MSRAPCELAAMPKFVPFSWPLPTLPPVQLPASCGSFVKPPCSRKMNGMHASKLPAAMMCSGHEKAAMKKPPRGRRRDGSGGGALRRGEAAPQCLCPEAVELIEAQAEAHAAGRLDVVVLFLDVLHDRRRDEARHKRRLVWISGEA